MNADIPDNMKKDNDRPFYEELRDCLLDGTEKLLRRKAALGENVAYAYPDGSPMEIPAAEALELFLKERTLGKGR